MSDVRDRARMIIDRALPGNTVITSNGATAAKYTEMTGLTHKRLTDSWASGGQLTGCNGFTGWFGVQMGARVNLGGFDLQGIVTKAGKPDAWIPATEDAFPEYGDILRHASFHVDVALDFEGELLRRAAGGQGGKRAGCDIIKRVGGSRPYDSANLMGWIDMEIFLSAGSVAPTASWFDGWWQVWDGNTYYYCFEPRGEVSYIKTKPARTASPPAKPSNRGRYRYEPDQNRLVIDWNPNGGGSTRETFWNAIPGTIMMNANSSRYSPLVAKRL